MRLFLIWKRTIHLKQKKIKIKIKIKDKIKNYLKLLLKKNNNK